MRTNNRRYVSRDAILRAGLADELEKLLPDAPQVIVLLEDCDGNISPSWRALIDETLRRLEQFIYNPAPRKAIEV